MRDGRRAWLRKEKISLPLKAYSWGTLLVVQELGTVLQWKTKVQSPVRTRYYMPPTKKDLHAPIKTEDMCSTAKTDPSVAK